MKNAKKNSTARNLSHYLVLFIIIGVILVILHFQGDTVHTLTTGKLLSNLVIPIYIFSFS